MNDLVNLGEIVAGGKVNRDIPVTENFMKLKTCKTKRIPIEMEVFNLGEQLD